MKNDNNPSTQTGEDKQDTKVITEQFLLGALIESVAIPFQSLAVPWLKMSEEEQTKFRKNIIERASEVVKKAVICIATGDRVNFRATCEQVQFKADGVKAALTLFNTPEAHALADAAGGTVLIVIEDGGRYLGTGDAIQPQPDNKPLFDDKPPTPKPSKTNVIDVAAKVITNQHLQSELEQAYGDGNLAAQEGRPQSDCPIMAGALCIEWVKGWKAWHEQEGAEPVKTAKLGELPNDAGVYVCDPDAADTMEQIILTGEISTPQEFGFFPTPALVVARLLALAKISEGMTVLEPSAGTGNIVAGLHYVGAIVDAIEVLESNIEALKKQGLATLIGIGDFLETEPQRLYDRVVMNPPFAKQADIKHVTHALKFLKPDGLLVSVMSASVTFRDNKLTADFRDLIQERGGSIEDLPEGSFKASGTNVNTVIVTIPAGEQA